MGLLSKLFGSKSFTIVTPEYSPLERINADFDPDGGVISTVLTCEKILAEQLSKLPLEVYQTDEAKGKIKAKGHDLYRLLHNSPNNFQTSTLFFQQLERWRNHYGNAFAKIIWNGAGKAEALELVHPLEIKGYKIINGKLYFYREKDKLKEALSNDDVLHFRFVSDDGIFGINPMKALAYELANIHQGKTTLNNAYKNNLNIDKYFETGVSNFANNNAAAAIEHVKREYSGSMNAKKTPFLPAGFKLVAVPSPSIQDAQILQSIGFAKRDIAAFYGAPLHLVGIDGQSYNSIEQQTLNFKTTTLQPIARMYRQELEKKLLFPADLAADISIEFNLNAIVEVDMSTRMNYLKTMHGMGVISSNAVAKMEGFETYEGGDLHFIQSQNIPVEEYEKYAKAAQAAPAISTNEPSPAPDQGGEEINTPVDVEAEAKAKLKGSVGGVQGILAIQAQVASGVTSYEAGLAILELIYGIGEEEGKRILGEKKAIKTQNTNE